MQASYTWTLWSEANRRLSPITATTIEHSFKNYRIICEELNVRPNGEAAFRNYLATLETIGILGKVTKSVKGRKGVRARLTIHDVPAAVLIERIEVN